MRCVGLYDAKAVPSFAALVMASTQDRKTVLQTLDKVVADACAVYDSNAPDVHILKPVKISKASADALIDGYDHRTVEMKRYLAKMIESLPAADADLCPYCSLDTNPDLDHILPKDVFPEFSLHARNLMPICTVCNRKKAKTYKTKLGGYRQFLNPGAEPSKNACVLQASLRFQGSAILAHFSIATVSSLSKTEQALVVRHYERLGLGVRYARRAHSYLASFKASVATKPQSAVARTLKEKINSSHIGEPVNGWRPALYRAIAQNEAQTLAWLHA